MKDWRGIKIEPGSLIVYPGRAGAHHWMMEARVIELIEIDHWGVKQPGLLVQPLRQGTYGRTNMKPVRLTALERVTVIPQCTEEVLTEEQIIAALIH